MFTNVIILTVLITVTAFRCKEDVNLDGAKEAEFKIKISKDASGKDLWITRTTVYAFGEIQDPSVTKIDAGFYDLDNPHQLIYKVVLDCRNGIWKTFYNQHKNKIEEKLWDSGSLQCEKGKFDLMAVVGCPDADVDIEGFDPMPVCAKLAYFIFNKKVLISESQKRHDDVYGEIMTDLPVYIRKGRYFKMRVRKGGASFDKYAYGKCIAFPDYLKADCTKAQYFIFYRSNSLPALNHFGPWTQDRNIDCDGTKFREIQSRIIPDGKETYKYIPSPFGQRFVGPRYTCCCSSPDGVIDNNTCISKTTYNCQDLIDCTSFLES